MIGRVELVEILGMVGACTVVLFAGFTVEALEGDVSSAWAVTDLTIEEPKVPVLRLPDEIRIERPDLDKPAEPAAPPVGAEPVACGCLRTRT